MSVLRWIQAFWKEILKYVLQRKSSQWREQKQEAQPNMSTWRQSNFLVFHPLLNNRSKNWKFSLKKNRFLKFKLLLSGSFNCKSKDTNIHCYYRHFYRHNVMFCWAVSILKNSLDTRWTVVWMRKVMLPQPDLHNSKHFFRVLQLVRTLCISQLISYLTFFGSLLSLMFTTSDQSKTCIPDHMKDFAEYKSNSSGLLLFACCGLVVVLFCFSILDRKYEIKINFRLDQLFYSAEDLGKQKHYSGCHKQLFPQLVLEFLAIVFILYSVDSF